MEPTKKQAETRTLVVMRHGHYLIKDGVSEDELQKVTDQFSGETDKLVEAKSKDVMSI